jgi:DNA polymerase-3 subunit epsilon
MDKNGYLNLKLKKADGRKKEITSFTTLTEGKNVLFRITQKFNLCQKYTGLYETKTACFQYKIKECDGACIGEITTDQYNIRVNDFIANNSFESQNMVIIDKGRNIGERSAVLIENGIYKGYSFYDLNYQINKIEILKNILIPMQNNRDTKNIIQSYLRKGSNFKIIKF